jgi:hypothetical protein
MAGEVHMTVLNVPRAYLPSISQSSLEFPCNDITVQQCLPGVCTCADPLPPRLAASFPAAASTVSTTRRKLCSHQHLLLMQLHQLTGRSPAPGCRGVRLARRPV